MATKRTLGILADVSTALGNAEAQLPVARELINLLQEAGESTTDATALLVEIEGKIRAWDRILAREGIPRKTEVPIEEGA